MFKLIRHKFSPLIFVFLFSISIISIVFFKPVVLTLFLFPLKITSSFVADAKAIASYRFVVNENAALKHALATTRTDALAMVELKRENSYLKKLLLFKEQSPFTTVAARVIARDPHNWSRGVVIDKGINQGIETGDVVIQEAGLVGRVIEVSKSTSKIALINDSNSAVSALIQRNRDEGLLTGTLLGGLVLRYLEIDSDCLMDDIVVTSGVTKNYPASIPIGRVNAIKEGPQGLGKYCVVTPFVTLKDLEEVLVIVK